MPLRGEGMSRTKSFLMGVLSGAVEPVAGVLTILAAGIIVPASVSFKLCSGGNAVRSSGGTDSGNVRRQPFQHRNCLVCSGFFGYDDSRCCARVTGIRKNGNSSLVRLRKALRRNGFVGAPCSRGAFYIILSKGYFESPLHTGIAS